MKYVSLYLVGLIVTVIFFANTLLFIYARVWDGPITSIRMNDDFQLGLRIFLSYSFGALYFYFKVKRFKIFLTTQQVALSIIGLIIVLFLVNIVYILILRLLQMPELFIHRISPLWLTFPSAILYYSILIKHGFKKVR